MHENEDPPTLIKSQIRILPLEISYKFSNEDFLEIRCRSANVVSANVPIVQIADVRVLQRALQALDRQIRHLSFDRQFVEIVHRVAGAYSRFLQVIRLYARLRVHRIAPPLFRLVLDDPRRERSHADLYLVGSLRGQQFHLQNQHVLTILCYAIDERPIRICLMK